MEKIVIIGGGGHAKVVISIIKKIKKFNILGYTDIKDKGKILGIKYLGDDNILDQIINKYKKCSAVIGIGKINVKDKRNNIFKKLKKIGFDLPVIISPNALINEGVTIDEGTVIFDGCIINSGTRIGKLNIINTNSLIEHDCILQNNVFIGPHATICGNVKINNNSFVGANSTIIQSIKIHSNCLIGAGAVIVNNLNKPGTYVGIPGKLS